MKKLIASFALVGTLGIGGILTYSMIGEEAPKESTTDDKVSATSEETEEVVAVEAPTERTFDTNGEYPWYYMTPEQIVEEQNKGEIVYLFSDAEELEKYTRDLAANPVNEPYDKEKLADSWVKYMDPFIQGVQDYYPNKLDYFMKLEEAKNALDAYKYEEVVSLIDEASTLR